MLKTVMLLIIFVETVIHKHVILFYVMFFDEYKAWKNSIYLK